MGVRKAFDDVLFPALRQQKAAREAGTEGEFQFPAALLSPVNWRLYLLGLERSNAHPHLIGQRMHLLHGLGVRMVLVCGAKPQIDDYLREHGQEPRHVGAYRVTDALALQGALKAAGTISTEMSAHLSKVGGGQCSACTVAC